jgi:DMSO/TMAO reductase YedYZ heme-binding membrane subunit
MLAIFFLLIIVQDLENHQTVSFIEQFKGRWVFWLNWFLLLLAFAVPLLWYFTDYKLLLWDVSWYTLVILLLIRPLAEILPSWLWLRRLILLRQGLGVLSAMAVVTNLFLGIWSAPGLFFSWENWGIANPSIAGHIAELTALILLITSNRLSQRLLGIWWKRVQRLAYLYFFSAGLYLGFVFGKTSAFVGLALVSILWIAAYVKRHRLIE